MNFFSLPPWALHVPFFLHLSSIWTLSKLEHVLFSSKQNEDLARLDCWLFVLFRRQEKLPASVWHVWESERFSLFGSFLLDSLCEWETTRSATEAGRVASRTSCAGCVQGPGMIALTGSFTIGTFTCDSSGGNGSPTKTRGCWDRTADHSFTPTGPSPFPSPPTHTIWWE